jgi:hypothetical protein
MTSEFQRLLGNSGKQCRSRLLNCSIVNENRECILHLQEMQEMECPSPFCVAYANGESLMLSGCLVSQILV